MRNYTCSARALWLIWLLAVVHLGAGAAAGKYKNKNKEGRVPANKQWENLSAGSFIGLLAATSAPTLTSVKAVQSYNHSLALPLLKNGEDSPPHRIPGVLVCSKCNSVRCVGILDVCRVTLQ